MSIQIKEVRYSPEVGLEQGAESAVPSRPALAPRVIAAHQRRRVIPAVAELAHELGIEGFTVSHICTAARMGRTHLYTLFDGREACLEYAFEGAFEAIFGASDEVVVAPDAQWLARLDRELAALFERVASEPLLAELCLVHAGGSNASAGYSFEAGVDVLLRLVSGGREAARARGTMAAADPGPLTEEYLAGSLASLARLRVQQGRTAELRECRGELTLLVAVAFFGPEEGMRAWRELAMSDGTA